MRGKCDGDTEIKWGGTSKAMEGHCASVCYNEIKSRGGAVEKNWLDGDASSEKEVTAVFPEAICMRCYGHKCCEGVLMHHTVWKQGLPLFRGWSVRPDVSRRDWCRCWQVQEQRL